ncbi:glycoside hydrolase family 75 protein [Streptomyces sp. SAS_281]|uniref:glycoside hydrolase family 75 protein n=1 Tax=Streptomyces sp. SAS_281 TaxID=3412744 RepID=UPI00403CEE9A
MRTLALVTASGAALLTAGTPAPVTLAVAGKPDPALTAPAPRPVRPAVPLALVAQVHRAPARAHRSEPAPAPARGRASAGVGAADLLARVSACEQVSNGTYRTDETTPATVPVCEVGGAVFWKADLDVDCDGRTTAACNPGTDPAFHGDTAFHTSDGRPLDAEKLPYVVVPAPSGTWDYAKSGIRGGGVAAVVRGEKVEYAVVGDVGPERIIGEASYATAKSLGIDPDPSSGGAPSGVTYILFKDSRVSPVEDHEAAVRTGRALAEEFVRGDQGVFRKQRRPPGRTGGTFETRPRVR